MIRRLQYFQPEESCLCVLGANGFGEPSWAWRKSNLAIVVFLVITSGNEIRSTCTPFPRHLRGTGVCCLNRLVNPAWLFFHFTAPIQYTCQFIPGVEDILLKALGRSLAVKGFFEFFLLNWRQSVFQRGISLENPYKAALLATIRRVIFARNELCFQEEGKSWAVFGPICAQFTI